MNTVSYWLKYSRQAARRCGRDSSQMTADLIFMERVYERTESLEVVLISVLTRWEIERGLMAAQASRQLLQFQALCAQMEIIPLDELVWAKASGVWLAAHRSGRKPSDVDILIATTALEYELTLVTRDKNLLHTCRCHEPPIACTDWTES